MDADQHRPENVANAKARPKQQARWLTRHVNLSESDSRSRSRQKVANAEARPKQQRALGSDSRSRSRMNCLPQGATDEFAPYTPYDTGTLKCLPQGATDEARRENCCVLEEKMRQVQDAIDNPERLPETKGRANKRIKWLKKQIAKEHDALDKKMERERELAVNAWIKQDKKMERERTRRYEQVDAEHRKRFPESAHYENADAQRRRLARYNKADNYHECLLLTDQRFPGPIRTPQKIIDHCKAQSAAAVAASSSSWTDEGQRDLNKQTLSTVGVSIAARDKQTLITVAAN